MSTEMNGAAIIDELMEIAQEDAKKAYLDRVWSMNKTEMFGELMRVHTESNKLLLVAHNQIQALQEQLLRYGKPVH